MRSRGVDTVDLRPAQRAVAIGMEMAALRGGVAPSHGRIGMIR